MELPAWLMLVWGRTSRFYINCTPALFALRHIYTDVFQSSCSAACEHFYQNGPLQSENKSLQKECMKDLWFWWQNCYLNFDPETCHLFPLALRHTMNSYTLCIISYSRGIYFTDLGHILDLSMSVDLFLYSLHKFRFCILCKSHYGDI